MKKFKKYSIKTIIVFCVSFSQTPSVLSAPAKLNPGEVLDDASEWRIDIESYLESKDNKFWAGRATIHHGENIIGF